MGKLLLVVDNRVLYGPSYVLDTLGFYLSCRFFIYWLVNALMHYNSVALFRVMGAFSQTASYANATACALVRQ